MKSVDKTKNLLIVLKSWYQAKRYNIPNNFKSFFCHYS